MMAKKHINPSSNYGPILRNQLNGVKQTAESFAKIHNLDPEYLKKVMGGNAPLTMDIINAVQDHPPLNVDLLFDSKDRNMFPRKNDTLDGVVIFTEEQGAETQRTFERGPKERQKIPFYDYRDTAMSRMSSFRPEWIKELYLHDGINKELPDWAFNNGHFEHQMTYFIGPVNFHWIDKKGNKYVRKMDTGDLNYITPFVPHSFTTRQKDRGLILAVTYGGAISTEDFQSEIHSTTSEDYLKNIREKITKIELNLLADQLEGVIINHHKDSIKKGINDYAQIELINNIPYQPNTKAFECYIKAERTQRDLDSVVNSDRWGYNIGNVPVLLFWDKHNELLYPGDSFFIQPNIYHSFRNVDQRQGKLLVMEIKPETGDPLYELALINKYAGENGLERVHTETLQWYGAK